MDKLLSLVANDDLQTCGSSWMAKAKKSGYYHNPSASFFTSMVYGFASHLPYSMDIEQPEYVPADFLNILPHDVDENPWFKYEDRRTIFNALINWGDTYKTGILLQLCNIFQKMLLGQFPVDYELGEDNYVEWKIFSMTKNEEYNRNFFETLKILPSFYRSVISAPDEKSRRVALEEAYATIKKNLAARFGGIKVTDANGNIVTERIGTIPIRPSEDVAMLVHWDNISFHDGIKPVIDEIRTKQLEEYIRSKNKNCLVLEEKK